MERGLCVKSCSDSSLENNPSDEHQLLTLFAGSLFGFFAQTAFFFLKQSTLLVKGNSAAVQTVCGQPAFFEGQEVQGGNAAEYQQKNECIHTTSAALPGPGIKPCRSVGCGPGCGGAGCVQGGDAQP